MGGESVCVRICVFCVWGLALLIFVFVGEVGVLFCFITACKRTFSKKKRRKGGGSSYLFRLVSLLLFFLFSSPVLMILGC